MTTVTGFRPTENQVKFVTTLVNERVPESERANWFHHLRLVDSKYRLQAAIDALKAKPVVTPAKVKVEGYYRNPETGELWRAKLSSDKFTLLLSKYSIAARTVRRLTEDGELVQAKRGTWTRYNGWDSRQLINRLAVRPEWKAEPEELTRYQYNFCAYCGLSLVDGESVRRNYGPKCAKNNGLPWGPNA